MALVSSSTASAAWRSGGDGAVGVLVVAQADIGQNGGVVGRLPFGLQLGQAALRARFRRGGQENFHRRIGQHDGADVAPVHQHIAARGQSALRFKQKRAHGRVGGYVGRRHADLLLADCLGDVLAVEQDLLRALARADIKVDVRQQRRNGGGVLGVLARAQRVQADGAVHCAGIDIDIAELGCQALGQAGLTGPGRAVDGDGNHGFAPFF